MNNGKKEPTRRPTWMLKYKQGSFDMKFRDNILRNIIRKAIKTENKLKLGNFEIRAGLAI